MSGFCELRSLFRETGMTEKFKAPLDPKEYERKLVGGKSVARQRVEWKSRDGQTVSSIAWLADDDISRDAIGCDGWERIGYFGAYRTEPREAALAELERRLKSRGFDPANAKTLLIYN